MTEKRRGLGRGLGALIPPPPPARTGGDRPVDVFFGPEGDAQPKSDETKPDAAKSDGAKPAEAKSTDGKATEGKSTGTPSTEAKSDDSKSTDAESAGTAVETPGTSTGSSGSDAGNGTPSTTTPIKDDASSPAADSSPAASGPELVPVPGAYFAELPVGSISPNPKQPRQNFDEEALAELVHSIREIGVLQPIVVRAVPGETGEEPRFELIMGERRWRASKEAELERIPAIVRDTQDDDLLRDALLENLHRSELNPLEEAAAYQQLLEDFGCTHEELASRIGRSRPQISNTIRLLRLPPAVQRRVAAGVLSAGHARALLGLDDPEAMDKLAQRIVSEGLSVRATEEAVAMTDSSSPVPAARRKPRAGGHHAELDDLAVRLADRLDTRVAISLGRNKGKISVEFASVEDLNRILEILAPEERKAFQGQD